MFGKNRKSIGAIIGKDVICNGDFTSAESARIDGTVNGNVVVGGSLIIGEFGIVHGYVQAKEAIIGGKVYGPVTAPDRIEFAPTAVILGDISTRILVVDEGAVLQGKCDMGRGEAEKPAESETPVKEEKPAESETPVKEEKPMESVTLVQKESTESATMESPEEAVRAEAPTEAAGTDEEPEAERTDEKEVKAPKKKKSAKSAFFKALMELKEANEQSEDNTEE